MALIGESKFTNKYEAAYNMFKSNQFFNESDWRKIATGSDASNLDMYIDALSKSKNINTKKFNDTYLTKYQDSDTRLSALYNEVYASHDIDGNYQVEEYKRDKDGNVIYKDGVPEVEMKNVSEYEYNKRLINEHNNVNMEKHLKQLREEARDANGWATALQVFIDLSYDGILEFFNKTGSFLFTVGQMTFTDKTFEDDWFKQWEKNYIPVLDRIKYDDVAISDYLLDIESQYSYFRDADGNLTTVGRYAEGIATTLGEMAASFALGTIATAPLTAIGGSASASSTVANITSKATSALRTAIYYTPLAAAQMGAQYKELTSQGYSVSTGQMFANQLWKTGLEIAIETALGAIFGSTGLDKLSIGRESKGLLKPKKLGKLTALAYFGKQALQEGTEEFLQEYSGFLVDKAFSVLVNEAFKPEFSWQNMIDAAVIGALTSAIHSSASILGTRSKALIDADDNKRVLSKIETAYYNAAMPDLFNSLEKAQKDLVSLNKNLSVNGKVYVLSERRNALDKLIKVLETDANKQNTAEAAAESADEKSKAINELKKKLAELDSVIDKYKKSSDYSENSENANLEKADIDNFEARFQQIYAAARVIQSFANVIGEERLTKASEILGRVKKLGNEGKFSEVERIKAVNEVCEELKVKGITVNATLKERIKNSNITKIKNIFTRKDIESDGSNETPAEFNESKELVDRVINSSRTINRRPARNKDNANNTVNRTVNQLFNADKNLNTVAISEDGRSVAANDNTIIVPEAEAQNVVDVLRDDAEQRLVQAVLSYNFSGNVIDKVYNTYKEIYNENGTKEDAVKELLFNPVFYTTMLTGGVKGNFKYNIADLDMYKFLSSLYDIEKIAVPKNIRNDVYKKKISDAKKLISGVLTSYLIIQPFADYNVSLLSTDQINRIKMYRESYNVANRIVSNTASNDDWSFINNKLNHSTFTSDEKLQLKKDLESNKPSIIRDALIKLDNSYKIAFYGSYDGTIYMPTNSLMNRTFNAFLQTYGLTVNDITDFDAVSADVRDEVVKNYGSNVKNLVDFYSDLLYNFTDGKYRLEVSSSKTLNAESGQFLYKSGSQSVKIVDTEKVVPYNISTDDVTGIANTNDKKFVTSVDNNQKFVNNLLNPRAYRRGANYYTIDDVIANPNLLKNNIKQQISKKYGALNYNSIIMYIKDSLKGSNFTICMSKDGRWVFANIVEVEKVLSNNFSLERVRKVADGKLNFSELIAEPYRFAFLNSIKVKLVDNSDGSSSFYIDNSDSKARIYGVIEINKSNLKDVKSLKNAFVHELQHAVEEFNKLNKGSEDNLLSKFDNNTRKKLINDIKSHVPSLFSGIDKNDVKSINEIVNNFLYYNTGEIEAYGSAAETFNFYPVLISNLKITLPWGSTYDFSSENKPVSKSIENTKRVGHKRENLLAYRYGDDVAGLSEKDLSEIAKEYNFDDIKKELSSLNIVTSDNFDGFIQQVISSVYRMYYNEDVDLFSSAHIKDTNELIIGLIKLSLEASCYTYNNGKLVNRNTGEAVNLEEYDKLLDNEAKKIFSIISSKKVISQSDVDKILKLKTQGEHSLQEVKDAFYASCEDKGFIELFNAVCKYLPDDMRIESRDDDYIRQYLRKHNNRGSAAGLYDPLPHVVFYNTEYIGEGRIYTAHLLLHELIHYRVYWLLFAFDYRYWQYVESGKYDELIAEISSIKNDKEREAYLGALTLLRLYNQIKYDYSFEKVHPYGMTNVQEFVAELSNPEFRDYLKKKSLWQKILDAIKSILGIEKNDTYDIAMDALNRILEFDHDSVRFANPDEVSLLALETNDDDIDAEINKELEELEGLGVTSDDNYHTPHIYSKGRTRRTRVPKKATVGTPLEPFSGKLISVPLQEFIMRSGEESYKGIDKTIAAKIKNGTLSMQDLDAWLRNAEVEDVSNYNPNEPTEVTFRLLNDTIFHNKYITSFHDLEEYVYVKSPYYYAMRDYFIRHKRIDDLLTVDNFDVYSNFLKEVENDPVLKNKFDKKVQEYARETNISTSYLRKHWMERFDGSIESGGALVGVAKWIAHWNKYVVGGSITNSMSLDTTVGRGKDKESTLKGADVIADDEIDVELNKSDDEDFVNFIANTDSDEKSFIALLTKMREETIKMYKENESANIDVKNLLRTLYDKLYTIYATNSAQYNALLQRYNIDEDYTNFAYAQYLAGQTAINNAKTLDELSKVDDTTKEAAKTTIRTKSSVVNNIRSINRTIIRGLNNRQKKLFLAENGDLFDNDLKVKKSLYQDVGSNNVVRLKDMPILLEVESRVRQLSKDIRANHYSTEQSLRYKKQMEREIAKLQKSLAQALQGRTKEPKVFVITNEEIYVDSDKNMPLAIKRFLETELVKTAKSTTQLLTNDTDAHVLMNYKTFIEENAETLNHLTQEDVDEIIDFYMSSEILPTTNRAKLYSTVQILLLGYILETSNKNFTRFSLTNEQIDAVEKRLELIISNAATILPTWRSVLKRLKPEEVLHKAMLKVCGVELSPATEGNLIMALNSGDVRRIIAARKRAYDEVVDNYKGRKRTVFDRLLRYERMAMLSGPGTWIRNQASNVNVTVGNRLAELLGKLLPTSKKHTELHQYTIVGTVVDERYKTWIKREVIDSHLLDIIDDGLIKYDPGRATRTDLQSKLTKLIVGKIESDFFVEHSGANVMSQFLQRAIVALLSDRAWVNKAFIRYLGKMMTEDNVDIANGLSDDILNTIADAYVMAAHDYMHKTNFWNKLEGSFRTYLHKHFNPTTADGIYFMYKQIFPFASASWNWFMEGLNYTPIGLAKGIIQFVKLENTVNNMENARQKGERVRSARFAEYLAKRNFGKGIIGTVGLTLGVILAATGKAALDEDDDKYKLVINSSSGPIYIDVSQLFGTSGLMIGMTIGGGFVERDGEFDYDKFIKVFAGTLNTMFLESTFSDMYNSFRYKNSFGEYLVDFPMDVAGMFVPNFVRQFANIAKKYNVNYDSGILGQLERFSVRSFAPFANLMPYQVDPYTGEPEVINRGWIGVNIVNSFAPVKVKAYNFSEIEQEAVSLGIRKGQLTGKYKVGNSELNLTSEELENLNEFYGKLNANDLSSLMNNQTKFTVEDENGKRVELTYSKMNDKQKTAVIERIMSNNSGLAKIYILTSSGKYKYYANDSEYDDLRNAGVRTNIYRKTSKLEGFVKIN